MRRAGVGLSLARIALRATTCRENGRRLLLTISRSSRSRAAASSAVKSINSSTRSFTALFLGTFPSEVGFARYSAQAVPSHRRSGTLTFHGRGLHIGPLPKPPRIDVDGRGDHPVDLERGSTGDIPPPPSGRLFPRWGIGNPARGLSLLIRRSGAVISDDRDEAGYECRPDKLGRDKQTSADNREPRHSRRLWRPMQNVAEVNLHWGSLSQTLMRSHECCSSSAAPIPPFAHKPSAPARLLVGPAVVGACREPTSACRSWAKIDTGRCR